MHRSNDGDGSGLEEGNESEGDESELPDQPSELRELRQTLPKGIQHLVGVVRTELLVELSISEKILRNHPVDHTYLPQLGLLLERWEFAGQSPKSSDRLEIYAQIDEIWFTVVIRVEAMTGYCSLVTMHRIYRRKVESRFRKGYLVRRED
jgi:hypothetical protein